MAGANADPPAGGPVGGENTDAPDGGRVGVVYAFAAAVAIVASKLPEGPPDTGWGWTALVLEALAAAVLAPGFVSVLLRLGGRVGSWLRSRTVLVLVLVILVAAGSGIAAPRAVAGARVLAFGCPSPVEVRVLTSPEGLEPARELAGAYERWTAAGNHACPTASLYAYAAPADKARKGLRVGWSQEYLRDIGPRPDVWLVDSTVELATLPDQLRGPDAPVRLAENRAIAWSPIVLGVSAAAVPQQFLDDRTDAPWTRLLSRAGELGWGVVRPDPTSSLAGLIATIGIYDGDTNDRDRRTPQSVERQIERSLDAGGYPLGDSAALLCRHRELGGGRTALVLSEQALIRFNQGRGLGGRCRTEEPPSDAARLLALYPAATASLDHRFVRLSWADAASEQEDAAVDFGRWLTSDGRAALLDIGLRPPLMTPREPVNEGQGVLPGAFDRQPPPQASRVDAVLAAYAAAHRDGRVLLVLDASGSMAEPAGPGHGSRFSVAVRGVTGAVALMRPHDSFGLWTFPADRTGAGVRTQVPITQYGRAGPRVTAALGAVRPAGSTPLLDAIAAGVAALGPGAATEASALVVLTDGEDTSSRLDGVALAQAVRGRNVRIFVITVGEAQCASRALAEVTRVSGGWCQDATFDSLDSRLADVFGALW